MTRLELIKAIGDVLAGVDVSRGSVAPNAPGRADLDLLREKLDKRQLQLVLWRWNENTKAFQDAALKLEEANTELKRTIADLKKTATTVENLRRVVAAIDDIGVAIGRPFI
jgi:hypothetical protein